MDNKRIYLSPPFITEEEIRSVADTLRNGWVAPVGPELDLFEKKLSERFGYPQVLCLNSGTAALHLAIKLAGLKQGDKVVIGTFTFVAAANAVLYEGGVPVFLDSERITWNLDPDLLKEYLEVNRDHPPVAVIVTHIFGRPAHIKQIREICTNYEVKLVENAAEAVGSGVGQEWAGSFGDFGILSFNGNKLLTTGGGGALICKNKSDYEKALFWSTQSREPSGHYLHRETGYNYRMSNVLAGVGLAQLEKLDIFLTRKRQIMEQYRKELSEVLDFPEAVKGCQSNHWLTTALVRKDSPGPDQMILKLEKQSIEARRFWKPLHTQPLFENAEYVGGHVAEDLFDRGICLPSGAGLSANDQGRVIEMIKRML